LPDLEQELVTVRDRIGKYQQLGIGEQDTKAALIVPILRALGWGVEDLEDVKLEYRRRPADNPVDYALFLLRTPRLLIEAKSLGSHLDDGKWAAQILAYATVAGVEWVALTDGNDWRIYNSHAAVPVEEKLFRVVRLSDATTRPGETLALLSKAQLQDHLIDVLWKSDFVDRQIRDALNSLFAADADASLVRLLRSRVPSLSPAEIRASLARLRLRFDFPASPTSQPAAHPPEKEPTRAAHAVSRPAVDAPAAYGTPWRHVTLAQLIDAGFVRVPLDLERRYRGVSLAARIEAGDRIVVGGSAFDSLSTAGGMARKSVPGSPTRQPHPQTNGWTFWQYRATDGTLHPLDDLRRQLHEGKVVSLASGRRIG
jgi:predicted type IV restriction endonuclease